MTQHTRSTFAGGQPFFWRVRCSVRFRPSIHFAPAPRVMGQIKAMAVLEEKIQEHSRERGRFSSSHCPCRKVPKPWQGWHLVLPENPGRISSSIENLTGHASSKEFRTAAAFSCFLKTFKATPLQNKIIPKCFFCAKNKNLRSRAPEHSCEWRPRSQTNMVELFTNNATKMSSKHVKLSSVASQALALHLSLRFHAQATSLFYIENLQTWPR